MANDIEQELLEHAKKRYSTEKKELLALLEIKNKEIEEMKSTIRQLEQKSLELEGSLADEKALRVDELYLHEQELLQLKKQWEHEQNASKEEREAGQAIIGELNETVGSYKADMKQLMEENAKEFEESQKTINAKEDEIAELKNQIAELEKNFAKAQSSAREEVRKFEARIRELDELLTKEKQAGHAKELEVQKALALNTASMLEERVEVSALREQAISLKAKIQELETEKNKIIEDWHVERRKWEELWQRERSVWENQKKEVKQWEDHSVKERAQWETMLRSKEEKEIRLTRIFSGFLSELNRWKERIQFPAQEFSEKPVKSSEMANILKKEIGKRKRLAVISSAILSFALLFSVIYWKYRQKPLVMAQTALWKLPVTTPSGIAVDPLNESVIWIADWKTGDILQAAKSDPSQILNRIKPPITFFHPNSIAISADGKYFFSLDSVSHKIYKHEAGNPSKILEEIPTPSPASLFLAVVYGGLDAKDLKEGSTAGPGALAVLDTVEKKIYFYNPSSLHSRSETTAQLPPSFSPLALNGGKSLWILDAKTASIWSFEVRSGGRLKKGRRIELLLSSEVPTLNSATGCLVALDGREVFVLFEGEPGQIVLSRAFGVKK